jgi:hypothetical protein
VDAALLPLLPALDALAQHRPGIIVIEQLARAAGRIVREGLAPEDLEREQALIATLQLAVANANARQQARIAENAIQPNPVPQVPANQPPVLGGPVIDATDNDVINNMPPPTARLATLSGQNGAFGRSEDVSTASDVPE